MDDFVADEELIRRQGVTPFSFANLPRDPFGSDQELRAFLAEIYAARRGVGESPQPSDAGRPEWEARGERL